MGKEIIVTSLEELCDLMCGEPEPEEEGEGMTREEAIVNLKMIGVAFVEPVTKEQRKLIDDTFEMAIKALSQDPCEDAVSTKLSEIRERQEDYICDTCIYSDEKDSGECYECVKGIQDWYEKSWECKGLYADGVDYICDTCKHKGEGWETEPCDGCGYEPCTDAVSRAEAQTALMMSKDAYLYIGHPTIRISDAVQAIRELPSVTQKPKTGEWKEVYAETDYRNGWIEFTCPNCEYQHGLESGEYGWSYGDPIPWKYCPVCGCKMKEGAENE